MRRDLHIACCVSSILALAASLAGAASAQNIIKKGVDVFQTTEPARSPGHVTVVNFALTPVPAGFFCLGSAPFTGKIELVGVPLTTDPPGVAANGDIVVERLKDGTLGAPIPVVVRALRLTGSRLLDITCSSGPTKWRVDVCLCGEQPTTEIVARSDQSCGCGHFSGTLTLDICLRFTEVADARGPVANGKVAGPLKQEVKLKITDMPWCPRPGRGEPVIAGPFRVQTECCTSEPLPGTTNFFPGWNCKLLAGAGVDCLTQYANLTECHADLHVPPSGHLHCINPICGKR
jgi:hypothetical protein